MKKLLSIVAAILFAATTFAQVDEVTLTTIGNGRTEDEATLRALRNALEQTFGTFVSANTSIVNDELVRDEIAATSKGNVKSYQKLSVVKLPDRTTSVTLKATISINKLISYARNKGSRAEFAGQTYAMNVKLLKLQQQNANKTLDVMRDNVIALCHGVFDYDIKLGEVRKEKLYNLSNYSVEYKYVLPFSLDVYATDVTSNIYSLITETFDAIRLTPTMVEDFKRNNLIYYGNFPVSESRIEEICDAIVLAIMDDFWKVRIKKINDNEYFSLKRYDRNSAMYSSGNGGDLNWERYRWLYSNKQQSTIIEYINSARSMPRNAIEFGVANQRMRNHPDIPGLISISILEGRTIDKSFSKWNTNVNGQIYQQKLASFNLCILLTDEELERFNGLELDGVTSPKHTSAPKPDKKKAAIKGYKRMSDLALNTPLKISQIRILTAGLPKKTYTISMTHKEPGSGTQTYKINVGAKKQECQYWEFTGDVFTSTLPNSIEGKRAQECISFDLISGDYTIKKFPKELSDFVYVK